LSRGSSPSGYPAEPLVSFQINRQLSGWNPPPLVIRAFGAHGHDQTRRFYQKAPEMINNIIVIAGRTPNTPVGDHPPPGFCTFP
jgi:hypothetical protein